MVILVKEKLSENGIISVELYDKTLSNKSYNYLVEFSINGRTTSKSKTFDLLSDANQYYDSFNTINFI